jgi:predicted MFS family arabinose efflux permease
VIEAVAAAVIALVTWQEGPLWIIFVALFLVGVGRAIKNPTYAPLISGVVDNQHFQSASAWNGGADHTAAIVGPPAGGLAVAAVGGSAAIFGGCAVLMLVAAVLIANVRIRERHRVAEEITRESLLAGARFIRKSPVMLGAITLDMFAVLLGGATALLPIFADDVLHVGAAGLGVLRSAPAAGALIMSLIIAHRGPFLRAGRSLLLTVVGFGISTIVFGLSTSFPLSLAALFFLGVFDAVSMIIRETIELRYTPDDMRGRVASIHFLFIGMSNEFGEFESGVLAAVVGATAAVTLGGIGTLVVVGAIAVLVPQLRSLRKIDTPDEVLSAQSAS